MASMRLVVGSASGSVGFARPTKRAPAMTRRNQDPARNALRQSWCRWTETVELFARRRVGRKRVDPQAYAALHRDIIRGCRACAASANDVEAAFYRYLEDLAQPWLDPSILSRADR